MYVGTWVGTWVGTQAELRRLLTNNEDSEKDKSQFQSYRDSVSILVNEF